MAKNLDVVLQLLKNEVEGDVASALAKMTEDYSMTWMYRGKQALFPRSETNPEHEMNDVYQIQNRSYEIKNAAEGETVVMIELIERYPDPETGEMHETPLVLVLEMKDGKVQKGRHYCDPQLSYEELSPNLLEEAYQGTSTKQIIK